MTPTPDRYRCVRCGRTFTAWAPAERHADADRHCRIEVVVAPATAPEEHRRNP